MFFVDDPRLLIAFADDINIIANSTKTMKEQFVKFEQETTDKRQRTNEKSYEKYIQLNQRLGNTNISDKNKRTYGTI